MIGKQVLGPSAILSGEHLLLKPAAVGPATPWHQDEAFRDPNFTYNEIGIWIALQDTDSQNGCMYFAKNDGTLPVLDHHSPNDDPRIHALECLAPPTSNDVTACPLKAGKFCIHYGRTPHFAPANTSNGDRLAYILIFNTPPEYRPSGDTREWNSKKETPRLLRRRNWLKSGGVFTLTRRLSRRYLLNNIAWKKWVIRRLLAKMRTLLSINKKKIIHEN